MTPEVLVNEQSDFYAESSLGTSQEDNALTQSSGVSLMFVDSSVEQLDALVSEVKDGIEVIVLDDSLDGIAQVTETLANYENISSLHFVSHGASGAFQLGTTTLDASQLANYETQLQSWQQSLTQDADILFYGCDIAAGQEGIEFLNQLSSLTGADIAASDDLTGSSSLGGDWELEFSNGPIESAGAFNESVAQSYNAILPQAIFSDTTETGRLSNVNLQTTTNRGIQVVNNPQGDGRAIHFDLRRNDPLWNGKHRAEIVPRGMNINYGQTYTYTFRTFIPQDWQNDPTLEHITQWHSRPDSGEPWRRPPVSLNVRGNQFQLDVFSDPRRISTTRSMTGGTVWSGNLTKGRWEEWQFEMTWSFNNNGVIRAWRNGELVLNRRGANAYNDSNGPFVKHGLYKPEWSDDPELSTTNRRHYFMDDIQHFRGTVAPSTVQEEPTVNTATTPIQEEPSSNNVVSSGNFQRIYQAENADRQRASVKRGFNASGRYAHLWKSTSRSQRDGLDWSIDVPTAGFYQLDWRYALARGYARNAPLGLFVNGDRSENVAFSNTGRWNNWRTTGQRVYLEAGENTIRLEGLGNGSANIDWMRVTSV
ncbi:MAG: DUF4347 domain-containing protein [Synechococcus sp.]